MPKLPLKTQRQAQNALTKVLRHYQLSLSETPTPHEVRTVAYLHQVLQGYFKIDVNDRIDELEAFAELGGFERATQRKN